VLPVLPNCRDFLILRAAAPNTQRKPVRARDGGPATAAGAATAMRAAAASAASAKRFNFVISLAFL
jgi:hypothetical protein